MGDLVTNGLFAGLSALSGAIFGAEGDPFKGDVYIKMASDNSEWQFGGVSITPTHANDITTKRVEEGSVITDNVRAQPRGLTIEGFYSEIYGRTGDFVKNEPGEHSRFRERLIVAADSAEIIRVELGVIRGAYMGVVESFEPNWNNEGHGNSLQFQLTVREIKFAVTEKKKLLVGFGADGALTGLLAPGVTRVADEAVKTMFSGSTDLGNISANPYVDQTTTAAAAAYPGVTAGVDWVRGGS